MTIKLNQVIQELREDHDNLRLLLDLLESESDTMTVDDEPDFEHPRQLWVMDLLRHVLRN